jgi:molecular chaperone DnaK (HSP70)/O-acetyl-ADP-ribose deacetylase (regulator of RNase III)
MEKMHLGIDLGTTNTVVSLFGDGGLKPVKLFPDKAMFPSSILKYQSSNPSSLSGVSPDRTRIGQEAIDYFLKIYKENRDETKLKYYKIYSEYKRNIATDTKAIEHTKEVLEYIIEKAHGDDINKTGIESLTITVPHVWRPESIERQKIRNLLSQIKIKETHLISEPIAAAAYYAFKRSHRTTETILICDLGGGTQDYTLCTIHLDDTVEVLDNTGSGESGGAIIDDSLVREIRNQITGHLDDHDLFYLKLEAEKLKLEFNKNLEQELQEDASESLLGKAWKWVKTQAKKVFNYLLDKLHTLKPKELTINGQLVKIEPKKLETATNLVLPKIEEHLREIQTRNPNVVIQKVVLVGGSSNNVFFQAKIRDYLQSEIVTFSPEDRYMAISFGASLVGSKQIKVKEKTSFHYGIMVQNKGNQIPLCILPKGTEFGTRVISKETFKPIKGSSSSTPIVAWRDEKNLFQAGDSFHIPSQDVEVRYAMKIDLDGVLVVECIDLAGNTLSQKEYKEVHKKLSEKEISDLIQPSGMEIVSTKDKSKLVEEFEINIQGKRVLLYNGDITWLNVDAIVSSDNSSRGMSTGVSQAILQKGGNTILQEFQNGQERLYIVVTSAGSLHAKNVFHAIIHNGHEIRSPKEIAKNCLEIADSLKMERIAIPIFGTGGLGLDFGKTSREIFSAIHETLPKTNLQMVVVSIPLNQNFQVFKGIVR